MQMLLNYILYRIYLPPINHFEFVSLLTHKTYTATHQINVYVGTPRHRIIIGNPTTVLSALKFTKYPTDNKFFIYTCNSGYIGIMVYIPY